jgi:hypothetical protein
MTVTCGDDDRHDDEENKMMKSIHFNETESEKMSKVIDEKEMRWE